MSETQKPFSYKKVIKSTDTVPASGLERRKYKPTMIGSNLPKQINRVKE
jgi:hypothetical protein